MANSSKRTRFLIISDTHSTRPKSRRPDSTGRPGPVANTNFAYHDPLPSADVLLHAGDISNIGHRDEYRQILNTLKTADAELKLVIAGNHDMTLDQQYFRDFGQYRYGHQPAPDLDAVRDMWTGKEATEHGIVYLEHGLSSFTLKSGAHFTIFTSPYQPEFCRWAFGYKRSEDLFNPRPDDQKWLHLQRVPDYPQVDIMMTHGPPLGHLDHVDRDRKVGCKHLMRAVERSRPRLHCFGHIHEGSGCELVEWKTADTAEGENSAAATTTTTIASSKLLEPDLERAKFDGGVFVSNEIKDWKGPEFGRETLFVNAAIMDVKYRPTNPPWVVDLNLPLAASQPPPDTTAGSNLAEK